MDQRAAPRISVVLCTFNGGAYVRALLYSLARQSRPLDELVVCDDASTDGTAEQVAQDEAGFGARLALVRRTTTLGAAANFADALARCSGDLVFLCDQDDLWRPEKLARVEAVFAAQPQVDLVQHDADVIDGADRPLAGSLYRRLGVVPQDSALACFARQLRHNRTPGCSLAVRGSWLRQALPVPPAFMHDEWLALVGSAAGRLLQIEDCLASYRLHDGNALGLRGIGWQAHLLARRQAVAARAAKLGRLATLQARLQLADEGTVLQAHRSLLAEAIAHLQARQSLPLARWQRLPAVMRELLSGRYRRHAKGAASALRDLVESVP
jgi:GT2 family glycosyltransferase